MGFGIPLVLPFGELPQTAFPATIPAVISGCIIELCAFIPQIYLTAYGWAITPKSTNGVGVDRENSTSEDQPQSSISYSKVRSLVHKRWSASKSPHFIGFLCMA